MDHVRAARGEHGRGGDTGDMNTATTTEHRDAETEQAVTVCKCVATLPVLIEHGTLGGTVELHSCGAAIDSGCDLVGGREQFVGRLQAKSLGGLEVDC
jgi:hypothetical protein